MADIVIRTATPDDLEACSRICYEAFKGINAQHGFPPDFPNIDLAVGMMRMTLSSPQVYGIVATELGRVVGSNFLWEGGPIAGVGPVTVDPAAQSRSVGRGMMQHLLDRARERRFAGVRLVQAAFNTRSMSLYTKLGFDVREPLVCLQGPPPRVRVEGYTVRRMTEGDVGTACELCRQIHGHHRRDTVEYGLAQGTATVVERAGQLVGYATEIGFFGHAVASSDDALIALIGAAEQITGPGMLLPSRNARVFRWCLANGLRVVEPMTLMSIGLYNEPRGAFIPSILF